MEKKLGGYLADKPKVLPFQDDGGNLCLSLEDIGHGWRSKPQAEYQVRYYFILIFYMYRYLQKQIVCVSCGFIYLNKLSILT